MGYTLKYTPQAKKDAVRLEKSNLQDKAAELLSIIKRDPYQNPPPYEKLKGDLSDIYSRRISYQHRLTYKVYEEEKCVKIIRMWTHYE